MARFEATIAAPDAGIGHATIATQDAGNADASVPDAAVADAPSIDAARVDAAAEPEPAPTLRPIHGSVGGGGMLLWTGHDNDRFRFEVEFDIEPRSRLGAFVAWRAFDPDHKGLLLAGGVLEAGAARPRLVVDLHGDVGVDLDLIAPVVGGGIRTTIMIWGPLGVALDSGAYVVIDGVDNVRVVLGTSLSPVVRW